MVVIKRILIGVTALIAILVAVANSQDGTVKVLQSYLYSQWGTEPNSFEPRNEPRDEVRDGLRFRIDIRYGDTFPNSYFDIVYPNSDKRVSWPVVIYIHGGGFFMGDKDAGDPMAGGSGGRPVEFIAQEGFAVVNLNYALAPEYRYPVPMKQLNQAIHHLSEHADEYGIDMNRVVIMGGSAGAQMTAQYGLLVSDSDYAADVGISPAIDASSIKALVLFSAPLKASGFGWRMNTMLWSYLGTKDLENSRPAKQVDILSHINSKYPATYITDGNQSDTFPEHAKEMVRILREKNVDHLFNYYEASEALLGHDYTGRLDTKHGRDNLEKAIAFMKQRTSLSGPASLKAESEQE